jgi:hypothetical protein
MMISIGDNENNAKIEVMMLFLPYCGRRGLFMVTSDLFTIAVSTTRQQGKMPCAAIPRDRDLIPAITRSSEA